MSSSNVKHVVMTYWSYIFVQCMLFTKEYPSVYVSYSASALFNYIFTF